MPAIVSMIGGIIALLWHPSHPARRMIQHFAAGVILAALATELLSEIAREHARPWILVVWFALGSLFMFGMKLVTDRLEEKDAAKEKLTGVGRLADGYPNGNGD